MSRTWNSCNGLCLLYHKKNPKRIWLIKFCSPIVLTCQLCTNMCGHVFVISVFSTDINCNPNILTKSRKIKTLKKYIKVGAFEPTHFSVNCLIVRQNWMKVGTHWFQGFSRYWFFIDVEHNIVEFYK